MINIATNLTAVQQGHLIQKVTDQDRGNLRITIPQLTNINTENVQRTIDTNSSQCT